MRELRRKPPEIQFEEIKLFESFLGLDFILCIFQLPFERSDANKPLSDEIRTGSFLNQFNKRNEYAKRNINTNI